MSSGLPLLEVISANRNNSLVISIAIKQVFAKRKKAWLWEAIVLENNRLLDVLKNPFQSASNSIFASHVFSGVIREYFARPIDGFNDLTRCGDSLFLSSVIRTGCVTYHKKLARLCTCNCTKNPLSCIGSVED